MGSNTVHVLVADVDAGGGMREVAHYVEMPQLSKQVARGGAIGERGTRAALSALDRVLALAGEHRYKHLLAGATAAVRSASDRDLFLERASARIGVPMRLISEEREAQLSFAGVARRHAGRREWVMADLGGGSTELVAAEDRGILRWASLPLGSGSFADRFLSDPPRASERAALRRAALRELKQAPECDAEKLVATGGTASNLPRVLSRTRPPMLLSADALLTAEDRLDVLPAARLALSLGIPAARVKALRGGIEILLLLLDFYGLDCVHVSHEGLRHGMILAYLEQGDDWWRG